MFGQLRDGGVRSALYKQVILLAGLLLCPVMPPVRLASWHMAWFVLFLPYMIQQESQSRHDGAVSALAVGYGRDAYARLKEILLAIPCRTIRCTSCGDAAPFVRQVSVVVCAQKLPEGSWRTMLDMTRAVSRPPALIVTSKHPDDRLWAEVLNLGAYDLLAEPFRPDEVFRALNLALLRHQDLSAAAVRV
ncbi:MAG TPA: hypothetical protein VG675_18260 [Bryobacteraceae bacterium]|nr:hypothetical protein [Bryobacteraceae bacterium]